MENVHRIGTELSYWSHLFVPPSNRNIRGHVFYLFVAAAVAWAERFPNRTFADEYVAEIRIADAALFCIDPRVWRAPLDHMLSV